MDWKEYQYEVRRSSTAVPYLDLGVHGCLFGIVLLILVGVHANVVESEFLLDAVLEELSLLQGKTIRLGNDRHDVDRLAELLQHDNVDWLQRVAGRCDEVQAAVDAGVLDVSLALGCEFLPQVCAVLVLDVLDDWVPAAVVVHEIAITWGVDNVQAETHAVLLDDVGDWVDFGGATNWLGGLEATLAVHKMRCEDGVDERRFAETCLSYKRIKCQCRFTRCWAYGSVRLNCRVGIEMSHHMNVPTQITLN